MPISARRKSSYRQYVIIVAASAVGGGAYGLIISLFEGADPRWAGAAQGVFTGGSVSAWCASFDVIFGTSAFVQRLRRLPFTSYIFVKAGFYLVGILGGIVLGSHLFSPLYGSDGWRITDPQFQITFILAVVASFLVAFLMEISRLLGGVVFANFLSGRYHLPREEERIFLFVDMIASTETAERIGHLQFHRLLNQFFHDLTEPVLATKGQIYTYVGDEMIVTWIKPAGLLDARCVQCYLQMADLLKARAPVYQAEYGVRPAFRAALHSGLVVAGEMGDDKREIVFLGDTVNTGARLEQACRELNKEIIVSGEILSQLTLPDGVEAIGLGPIQLRGKDQAVEVFSLRRHHDDGVSVAIARRDATDLGAASLTDG